MAFVTAATRRLTTNAAATIVKNAARTPHATAHPGAEVLVKPRAQPAAAPTATESKTENIAKLLFPGYSRPAAAAKDTTNVFSGQIRVVARVCGRGRFLVFFRAVTACFEKCLAAVAAAGVFLASAALAVGVGDMEASRYDVIIEKEPFGPPPKTGPTPEELAEQARLEELAKMQEEMQDAFVIPPGLEKVKITLLSRFRGIPGVGFVDGESGREFYLHEGQSFDGFECRAIDLSGRTATLAKDGREAELPIWINPATTNRGDVTTYGQPGGRPVDLSLLQTKTDWEVEQERAEKRRQLEEQRERRRKQREEWEERRRKHAEEMAALTPEQRERRMHDINLDIIMNNSGPPLPIELDEEDERRLEEAGYEIPPPEERDGGGRDRGFRGGPGGGGPGFRGRGRHGRFRGGEDGDGE